MTQDRGSASTHHPALPTRSSSIWRPAAHHDPLPLPDRVDVVVIGGGIAGMCAATQLALSGRDVALLDARNLGAGTTGSSSAKVSVLHELHAHEIAERDGLSMATNYVQANAFGLDWIRSQVEDANIDCDWAQRTAYTYVTDPANIGRIGDEVRTLCAAGIDARRADLDTSFAAAAAVAVDGQAQFDPVRFLVGLRRQFEADCGHIYTGVQATGVDDSRRGATVHTNRGSIECRWVVMATGLPFLDRALFFARTEPKTSYTIAVDVESAPANGMYLSADGPTRSLRTATTGDGRTVLLVGGEGHKTGQGGDTMRSYRRLVRWANEKFGVKEVTHRFSTHDYTTPDRRPYVGPMHSGSTSVLVMTGFNKWGFTNAAAGAHIVSAHVGRTSQPEWAHAMSTDRLGLSNARELVAANANVASHMVGGWFAAAVPRPAPRPGHGRVTRRGLKVVASSADDDGVLCSVSGFCTHLGGAVAWNPAEKSWDCPLHGSRFQRTGEVLCGPAIDDLERQD